MSKTRHKTNLPKQIIIHNKSMVLRCNFLLELWNMHGNLHCIWIWIVNGQSSRHPHINVHKWQRKVENMKNTFIEKDMRIYFVLTYFVCRVETQTLCRLTSNETKLFDKSNEWIALQQEKKHTECGSGSVVSHHQQKARKLHMWSGYKIEIGYLLIFRWNLHD